MRIWTRTYIGTFKIYISVPLSFCFVLEYFNFIGKLTLIIFKQFYIPENDFSVAVVVFYICIAYLDIYICS